MAISEAPAPVAQCPERLTVACLCADWCGTCRDYRAVFDAALQAQPDARGLWIDIEDQAELLGAVEIDDFPTLLIARGDAPLFFGTVTPHAATLLRLLQAACAGQSHLGGDEPDAAVQALASRLRGAQSAR